MARLVQCIPNFSEGRRQDVVAKIVDAIASTSTARVVDYSSDSDHNRCVVTFIGSPEDVRASILAGARAAVELIDMNAHTGAHPRIGAVDVVPVVPVVEMTMADAVGLSYEIGRDIAEHLHVPVYFYERSAIASHRANLAAVRKGGYEEIKRRGLTDGREPDLGPGEPHPTAGATVVGARGPLIAYNVNLAGSDVGIAREIAARIRRLRDSGQAFPGVKAIGVYLKSRGIAQVSTNITQPHQVSMYDVYAFVEREAMAMGDSVLESELIGAIREDALIEAVTSAVKLRSLDSRRVLDHWIR